MQKKWEKTIILLNYPKKLLILRSSIRTFLTFAPAKEKAWLISSTE